MAALGLAIEAGWSGWSDSIAAHLLHAIGQPICSATCCWIVESLAFPDLHQIGSPRIPAADSALQVTSEARWQVHDHVQMLAPVTSVVLPKPDPPAPANFSPAPGCQPDSETCEEAIQIPFGLGIKINRMEVERGLEWPPDLVGEVLGPDGITPLLGRDPLRLCLASSIEAAFAPLPRLR